MDALTEMDRLRLTLAKERDARLRAEAANVQMMQRQLEMAHAKAQAEFSALHAELRERYTLVPGDEIAEDGTIRRAPQAPAEKAA